MTNNKSPSGVPAEPELARLREENASLKAKLAESEETLRAIHAGEVDAIVVSTDVGEQIFTLKGAEEPYRILFEQMNEGAVTVSGDGDVLYSNQSFARAMKAPLEGIIGTDFGSFIYPHDTPAFQRLLNASLKEPARGEVTLRAVDGTLVPMLLSISALPTSNVPTYCVVAANLTERKRSEEALKRAKDELEVKVQERTRRLSDSERLFRAAIDNFPDVFNIYDSEGRLLYVNRRALERTGLKESELIGRRDDEIAAIPPEVYCQYLPSLSRAYETGEIQMCTLSLTLGLGGDMQLIHYVPVKDEGGKITNVLGITTDISQRLRYEKELEVRARELARSNEELQQFAYVASHDLQEPLRMISAYLGLLDKKYGAELSSGANEYLQTAVRGSERMRELIDDLLQFSRIDTRARERSPVDMNAVVRTAEDNLAMAIREAGAEITVGPLPTIVADCVQMTQVMQNLLSNAVKFHDQRPPRAEVSASKRHGEWVFAIRDNGIGIDPRYHGNLFKMFQRLHTRDEYPGTGIGLAISKKIVERHGGRIWVESEPGMGSTFYFSIPEAP